MSFREIALTVRAVNRASAEFNRIQSDAESLAARVKSLGLRWLGWALQASLSATWLTSSVC